jgi:uncharacterized protein YjeT (DUF2065 family)
MELVIERIFAPGLFVVGLSHALHPKLWSDLFSDVRKSRYGGFLIAMSTLPFGLAIVVLHNRWVLDWPVFITVVGWGMVLKSVVYFLVPAAAERVIAAGVERDYRAFRIVGIVMAVLGGILTWKAFMA